MRKILFFIGTRPELIKLYPLIKNLKKYKKQYNVKVCFTNQHTDLIKISLKLFDFKPDYNLNIMKSNQTLTYITQTLLKKINNLYDKKFFPDLTIVQGDTSTAFAAALASFYKKIKIAHIEAGLRTYNKNEPYPEEINRSLLSKLADFHFAPTALSKKNLTKENIKKNIFIVGNTVIDSVKLITKKFNIENLEKKNQILVTIHRREHLLSKLNYICNELLNIKKKYKNWNVIWPIHPNPKIKKFINKKLRNSKNIKIINHLDYLSFLKLVITSKIICSDSGGIQEEATFLKKKILIIRNVTERPEVLKTKNGELVVLKRKLLSKKINSLIKKGNWNVKKNYIFGNGKTSEKIIAILKKLKF